LLWHSSRQGDAAHSWLRSQFVELAQRAEPLVIEAQRN
jgi:hypothetical protein